MNALVTPATATEVAEAVRAAPRVLAVGARTKPRLSQVSPDVTLLSTRQLSGIIEYEPDEYTFTALADRKINIQAISTSEIKVSVLIDEDETELAVRVLHTAYGLDAE